MGTLNDAQTVAVLMLVLGALVGYVVRLLHKAELEQVKSQARQAEFAVTQLTEVVQSLSKQRWWWRNAALDAADGMLEFETLKERAAREDQGEQFYS